MEDIIVGILALTIVGAPALAISARIALKPLAEALARMREAFPKDDDSTSDARIAALEEEVRALRVALEHRLDLRSFDSALDSGPHRRELSAGGSAMSTPDGSPDRVRERE